jgi:hypothetical protein
MTAPAPPADAINEADSAAGIAAVVLAVFVAIAVAVLFLALIGADRSGRLVARSSDVGHPQLAKTLATSPEGEPAHHSLNNQQDP